VRGAWWVALAAGCGRTHCERNAAAVEDCGIEVDRAWIEACREGLQPCNGQDEERIEAWYACTEASGIYACEPDESAYPASLECQAELEGLSDACPVPDQLIAAAAAR
jgi:hypothetical protein